MECKTKPHMTQDFLTMPLFGQMASCIETLKNIIEFADDDVWTYGQPPFWQMVLHAISSADMYFSTFDRNVNDPMGQYKLPSNLEKYSIFTHFDNESEDLSSIEPATKLDLMSYLQSTREKIRSYKDQGVYDQLDETSGFSWLPFTKFELILHNIRHMSGHNGTLNQILKANELRYQGWLGRKDL